MLDSSKIRRKPGIHNLLLLLLIVAVVVVDVVHDLVPEPVDVFLVEY